MKKCKIWIILALAAVLITTCGCQKPAGETGQTPDASDGPTWQEQFDLGVRYLSEGNYREAIIAFTAAIEIDPKRAPAYVGRGDAYVWSGETESNLVAAKTDYEKAIELDETSAEAYLGLADVYIRQGEYEKAREILQEGLERTGSQSVEEKLSEVENTIQAQAESEGPSASVSLSITERIMTVSLTCPGLPEKVWINAGDGRNPAAQAIFWVSFSTGNGVYGVHTTVSHRNGPGKMVAIPTDSMPDGYQYAHLGVRANTDSNGFNNTWSVFVDPVDVSRSGDTIIWSFTMPKPWRFSASDIQYFGYNVSYYESSSLENRIFGQGTFQRQGEEIIYLNNGSVTDLDFLFKAG